MLKRAFHRSVTTDRIDVKLVTAERLIAQLMFYVRLYADERRK